MRKVKVAVCYINSQRTIVRNNHVTKVTDKVKLYFLETPQEAKKYKKQPLFNI